MALFRRCTWTLVILSLLVFLLSCLTSFVGLMFPFTGFGEGLTSIGMHTVFYSMMAALPASVVVGAYSRKALAWLYWALYAIASAGIYILDTANRGALAEPLRFATPSPFWSAKRAVGAFGSVTVLYLVLAVLTEFLFRIERCNEKTLAEITSDTV